MTWTGIETWIREHAPELHAAFLPPASGADIAAAEEILGLPLPADLAAWWRLFGGVSGHHAIVPPRWHPHGLSAALRLRDVMIEATRGVPFPRDFRPEWEEAPWEPAWLPIAGDGMGSELFVDLRDGSVTEWRKDSGPANEPLWPNVTAMLDDTLHALTTGSHDCR